MAERNINEADWIDRNNSGKAECVKTNEEEEETQSTQN